MNFIVAVDEKWGIGYENELLFHIPEDMQYFKKTTSGKTVVMGDVTLRSLPGAKPLPGRTNIVLCDKPGFHADGVTICTSLPQLFEEVKKYPADDVFVIGGATVYNLLMPYCKKAYITKVCATKPADTFIHNIEQMENWKRVSGPDKHTHGDIAFSFNIYENTDVRPME